MENGEWYQGVFKDWEHVKRNLTILDKQGNCLVCKTKHKEIWEYVILREVQE